MDISTKISRCQWSTDGPIYQRYHDNEWGVPCFDDSKLFEFLVLESAQAGLSWITILKKRDNFKKAFSNFDVSKVACFDQDDIERLMNDASIIRNKRKIESAIGNAKKFLLLQQSHGSFANYIWSFFDGKPIQNTWAQHSDVPAFTPLAEFISRDMKKRGFCFFGKTICYSFMQAMGMVNDHTTSCFRHKACSNLASIN